MALQLKPTDKILHNYQLTLREFRHASIEHESATRSAFQTLLAELARRRKWQLIPEHPYKLAPGATIHPDVTLRNDFSINRGDWEAKDTHDDLETEFGEAIGDAPTLWPSRRRQTETILASYAGQVRVSSPSLQGIWSFGPPGLSACPVSDSRTARPVSLRRLQRDHTRAPRKPRPYPEAPPPTAEPRPSAHPAQYHL
ncbi:MAG: hypothetical protein M9913_06940 [Bryobacteraceae bacterium]|nr:hypothetical protein [Solibacteraceae bacterium]MCO5350620.1 hypothetical protein [Bryobacteraceae bacterium]